MGGENKPRLLDLYCGGGGAGMGYSQAGFEVVGLDVEPMPNYPFEFIQADAIQFMEELLDVNRPKPSPVQDRIPQDERRAMDCDPPQRMVGGADRIAHLPDEDRGISLGFAAIHASPPCPLHSSLNGWSGDSEAPELIAPTRELLEKTGLPYVIENVPGAPLINPVQICGQALGLRVRRHRLFETNFPVMVPPCHHPEPPVIVVGGSIGRKVFDPRRKAIAPSFEEAKEVMEMPWAKRRQEVVNAIPPAYTRHVGSFLAAHLEAERKVAA